jgi:predicted esterase
MATYIRLDGVPTLVRRARPGESLVLLHPVGADARAFAPNLDALAAPFHVLTPDRTPSAIGEGHDRGPDHREVAHVSHR